jgi:hypothetical protein
MEIKEEQDSNLVTLEKELLDMVETILKLRKTPPELIDLDDLDIWKEDVKKIPVRLVEIIKQVNKEVNQRNKEKVF